VRAEHVNRPSQDNSTRGSMQVGIALKANGDARNLLNWNHIGLTVNFETAAFTLNCIDAFELNP
jgi:hypothetical protein